MMNMCKSPNIAKVIIISISLFIDNILNIAVRMSTINMAMYQTITLLTESTKT